MSDQKFTRNDIMEAETWDTVSWSKVNHYVSRLQYRIYKASREENLQRMFKLQLFLLRSRAACLLAVQIVTTRNKGKKITRSDEKIIRNPSEKYLLAMHLKLDGKATSIRRVWSPKPGKAEKRPRETIVEFRAKQALAKLALEPQWEAKFEPNSYGFRPGRACHDAIEAIFLSLHQNAPKWIYHADIRKEFEKISFDLNKLCTFPLMRRQIRAWLKAGIMEEYANQPKNQEIIPQAGHENPLQGGVISPLLANIALHGLEEHLKKHVETLGKPHPGANRGNATKRRAISVIRYADDLVLIHRNKYILDFCIKETKLWLQQMGLEISEEKSKLRDGRKGFLFLGFQVIQVRKIKADRFKTKIVPCKQKRILFLKNIREVIQKNKSSPAYKLIRILRPKIIGWANYYRFCECKDVFSYMTDRIFRKLRAWAFRRSRKGRLYWKEKYFPSGKTYFFKGKTYKSNWILVGSSKGKKGSIKTNFLPHMSWVFGDKYVKVQGDASPYSRNFYWVQRTKKHSSVENFFRRQKSKNPYCKELLPFYEKQTLPNM